jgi:hypothetical protein
MNLSALLPRPRLLGRTGLASALALLGWDAAFPRLAAQSSDFNTGNDSGWTHYTLLDYGAAKFSFPADDTGGKAYRIYAPPTGDDPWSMGNARAGSLRTEATYSGRFTAGADVLDWNAVWAQETGLLFYLSEVGLGTSDGYAATYSSGYRNLYLTLITDERDSGTVGELRGIVLDPAHDYRLVVSSHDGDTFLFQLFDKVDLVNPWCSVVCEDANSTYAAGLCALFVWERTYPSAVEGAEATFDNYQASLPPVGAMPATVTDVSPQPGGKATAFYPTVSVTILDRDTSVDPTSITLSLDGVWIPNAALTIDPMVHKPDNPGREDFSGATVSYPMTTVLPWGSRHTNQVAFADNTGTRRTNTWVWTSAYPYLPASNSLPTGSLSVRGFDVRTVQSSNGGANLPNTLERARQQLAVPPLIPVDLAATSLVQVLSWDKSGTPANVPGLCPGTYINIAVESLAYLELSAGVHRFHIKTDDRAGVYSGTRFSETEAQVLWENPDNTADSTFEFFVEAPGLYPVRALWEETAGSAYHYLYSVDLTDLSEVPINDPANPTGVVRAWYPLVCRSSAVVTGPYTVEVQALNVVNTVNVVGSADCSPTVVGQMVTGGTLTVPVTDAARFYVLDGPRRTRISHFGRDGANVILTYQVQ